MTISTSVAILMKDGVFSDVIFEGWPASIPKPHVCVVDQSGPEYCDADTLLIVPIDGEAATASCFEVASNVYDPRFSSLCPSTVLAAILAKANEQ